ncbi:MAG: oligosaccharide flippase family protein, partial [Eubacteriales bacterium]|nr:oligosaccharide flippase family protein [Eubacteriales bacterium]
MSRYELSGNTAVKKAGKRYVGGMLILSASTLLCKVIGLLFKIPMLRIIGIEGMAYFSSAYHIYMLLLTMSTAGLPVALSMMTAKSAARGDRSEVSRIWQVSLFMLLPLGVIGTAVLYFGAGYFAEWISIPGSEYAIKAISPTLFFICVSSAARGYFQGHEIMTPTALSQLIESLSKLLLGMGFAYVAINRGADSPHVAAAAILGLTVGVAGGALYLTLRKLVFPQTRAYRSLYTAASDPAPRRTLAEQMIKIAFPVTISASVTSLA